MAHDSHGTPQEHIDMHANDTRARFYGHACGPGRRYPPRARTTRAEHCSDASMPAHRARLGLSSEVEKGLS